MYRVDIPVTIHVEGPFITQSALPGSFGTDAVMARNPDGMYYIAGTQVAGRLKEAWEELECVLGGEGPGPVPDKSSIDMLLGKRSGMVDEDGYFEPFPKLLHFSDFLCHDSGEGRRYRIEIDGLSGAVKKGAIAVIESPFEPGQIVPFGGKVTFLSRDKARAERICGYIRSGMAWIDQIGAFASVGFGKVRKVVVGRAEFRRANPGKGPIRVKGCGFGLAIMPEGPFCIARRPTRENNLFISEEIIPGNVIIGAISRMLERLGASQTDSLFKDLWENLSNIRVLHAFPADGCFTRPVAPPLSLVKAGKRLWDVALLQYPCLIDGKAPAFSPDWKSEEDVKRHFGWAALRRELRVRTAIDSEKRRSKEEALFAYEMIVPDGRAWLTRVDAERIEDEGLRLKVLSDLADLLEIGIFGLGKTKAVANAVILDHSAVIDRFSSNSDQDLGELAVVLQTPALLLCPQGLGGEDAILDEKSGHKELFSAYKEAWKELCPGLHLMRFFAKQRLSGGTYQHFHFRKDEAVYYPWILTEPGSVFVFKAGDSKKVKECLKEWLVRGLPIPPTVRKFYGIPEEDGRQWGKCPFIPQNGFGEVLVNLSEHQRLCPASGVITQITPSKGEELWQPAE